MAILGFLLSMLSTVLQGGSLHLQAENLDANQRQAAALEEIAATLRAGCATPVPTTPAALEKGSLDL